MRHRERHQQRRLAGEAGRNVGTQRFRRRRSGRPFCGFCGFDRRPRAFRVGRRAVDKTSRRVRRRVRARLRARVQRRVRIRARRRSAPKERVCIAAYIGRRRIRCRRGLQPPRRRIEYRRQWRRIGRQRRRVGHRRQRPRIEPRSERRRRIAGQAIARLRENGRSVWCRHADIRRERLLRTRISRAAAKVGANIWTKVGAKGWPAERQARVRTHGRRRTRGARSQPMQQAFHGATIER